MIVRLYIIGNACARHLRVAFHGMLKNIICDYARELIALVISGETIENYLSSGKYNDLCRVIKSTKIIARGNTSIRVNYVVFSSLT